MIESLPVKDLCKFSVVTYKIHDHWSLLVTYLQYICMTVYLMLPHGLLST